MGGEMIEATDQFEFEQEHLRPSATLSLGRSPHRRLVIFR